MLGCCCDVATIVRLHTRNVWERGRGGRYVNHFERVTEIGIKSILNANLHPGGKFFSKFQGGGDGPHRGDPPSVPPCKENPVVLGEKTTNLSLLYIMVC